MILCRLVALLRPRIFLLRSGFSLDFQKNSYFETLTRLITRGLCCYRNALLLRRLLRHTTETLALIRSPVSKCFQLHMENKTRYYQQRMSRWKILGNILGIGVVVSILSIAFYWYEFRPSAIRQECEAFANSQNTYGNAEAGRFLPYMSTQKRLKRESMYIKIEGAVASQSTTLSTHPATGLS